MDKPATIEVGQLWRWKSWKEDHAAEVVGSKNPTIGWDIYSTEYGKYVVSIDNLNNVDWIFCGYKKPEKIEEGQRWQYKDIISHDYIVSFIKDEYIYFIDQECHDRGHETKVGLDNSNWKFLGFEPLEKYSAFEKPDKIRFGQKWKYHTSSTTDSIISRGSDRSLFNNNVAVSNDTLLNSNRWHFFGEKTPTELKAGQVWARKNSDRPEIEARFFILCVEKDQAYGKFFLDWSKSFYTSEHMTLKHLQSWILLKENNMSEPKSEENKTEPGTLEIIKNNSFVQMTKEDGIDVIYRMGAINMTKVFQVSLDTLLKAQGVKRKHILALSEFFRTDFGAAGLSYGMGLLLTYLPMIKENPKAKRMAKEFRVGGMFTGSNRAVSELFQGIASKMIPMIMQTISMLPDPEGTMNPAELMEAVTRLPTVEEAVKETVSAKV